MSRHTRRNALVGVLMTSLAGAALCLPAAAASPAAALHGGLGPANPFLASGGRGAMHSDTYSSDASPTPGPGAGAITSNFAASNATCPTTLLDRHGNVVGYCVDHATGAGQLRLLAPDTLTVLASYTLPRVGAFGGFYMFLDSQDRAVLGDGDNHVLRISHAQAADGTWSFHVDNDWDVSTLVPAPDYIESITPDFVGRIWWSTADGGVGVLDPRTGVAHSVSMPAGEKVANSLSAASAGIAVASDHALYIFRAGADGVPTVVSRQPYDRGSGQKPGQLSWGTGTTPTFFGGPAGDRYLTIADNADSQEHLLVYRVDQVSGQSRQICQVPIFQPGASAAENAPIGVGNSVVIANTYGYNYKVGAPATPIPGGLTRIDVRDGGCTTVWSNTTPSAAVPKLSTCDGYIYTVQRTVSGGVPDYALAVIDSGTGQAVSTQPLGTSPQLETLQLAGVTTSSGDLYQGTVNGVLHIRGERS